MIKLPSYDEHFKNQELGQYQLYAFEKAMEFIKQYKLPTNVAIDVGGHVGHFSYNMAKIFKEVYVFEPVKDNFDCLKKNLEGFENVKLFNFGLSDENVKKEIHLERFDNSGSWSIDCLCENNKPAKIETVELKRFDDIFKDIEPNYIKMDIQGHEPHALRGMTQTLKKSTPLLQIEMASSHQYCREVEAIMKELGYVFIKRICKENYFLPLKIAKNKIS